MYIRIFSLALIALLLNVNPLFAQEAEEFIVPNLPEIPETFGTVSCFDYYDFGSVFPAISTPVQSAVTGSTMTFDVDIENSNPYPVVDGTLYVKIFRAQDVEENIYLQASHVVDQFKAVDNINIEASATQPHTFEWEVPLYAGAGEYYAATFFVTNDRYNLSGLTFTDDIIGGNSGPFTISSESDFIYFDKNNVTLNGEDYRFIGPPLQMPKQGVVDISFPVVNDSDEEQEVIIEWKTNEWDSLRAERVLNTAIEILTIPANSEVEASYQVPEAGSPVYLVEPRLMVNNQTVSAMNVRFVREDTNVPRINFPSITSYPLKAGQENTLFSCLHNSGQAAGIEDGELTLTLYDTDNNQIHRYQYTGVITGAMMGVKDVFVPSEDITDFTLHAVLSVGGNVVEDVRIKYRCEDINSDVCVVEKTEAVIVDSEPSSDSNNLMLVVAISLVLLILVGALHHRKQKIAGQAEGSDNESEDDIIRDPDELV